MKDPQAEDTSPKAAPLIRSVRLRMTILVSFAFLFSTAGMASIPFGFVCMLDSSSAALRASNETLEQCGWNRTASVHPTRPLSAQRTYDWSKQTQANLLAAPNWGSLIVAGFLGRFIDRYGVRKMGSVSIAFVGLSTMLVPIAANVSPWLVFVLRIFFGFGFSGVILSIFKSAAFWNGPKELSLFISLPFNFAPIGTVALQFISGLLCSTIGWQYIFYIWGCVTFAYTLIFIAFYRDSPEKIKLIPREERLYLEEHHRESGVHNAHEKAKSRPPLKAIFSSPAVWAFFVTCFCCLWPRYFFVMFTPTYFREAFNVNVRRNGIYSGLSASAGLVGRIMAGYMGDRVEIGKTKTTSIKVYTAVASLLPALCMLLTFIPDCTQPGISLALIILCLFFFSFSIAGSSLAPILMSPEWCGMIGGIGHMFTGIGAIALPYIINTMTAHGEPMEWKYAFALSAGITGLGGLIYLFIGSAERQHWGSPPPVTTSEAVLLEPEDKDTPPVAV